MTHSSLSDFVSNLEQSRLLTEAQMKSIRSQLDRISNPVLPKNLAQLLVEQEHLTRWQANQLLKGQTGFVLQQYHMLNPVGKGGMGHVFRALRSDNGDVVAIKVMARRLKSNQALVSRFRREIKASARLNSPHVIKALDAGQVGSTDFLVMEYVNGDQLDQIIDRLGSLPTGLACEIARQAAVGLQHAHEHQMVHRDIKPGNLMIDWNEDGSGTVKVMDMGLVRLNSDQDTDEETVTKAGQVMGTPDYMSPEQGWDTSTVDIRSDIYSLGCALFKMLSGEVPFRGTNPLQLLSQRLQRDAPSVQSIRTDIPDSISSIVSRMTARDPASRFQTPQDVVDALQPHCEPLTRSAMKKLAQLIRSETSSDASADDSGEVDATYQRFLDEMQAGASVTLMTEVPTFDGVSNSTLPVLDLASHSFNPSNVSGTYQRRKMKRGQLTGFVVMAVSVAVLVIIFLVIQFSRPNSTPTETESASTETIAEDAEPEIRASFDTVSVLQAVAGETWTYKPKINIEGETSDDQELVYKLTPSTPYEISVNPETGQLSWQVSRNHPPGAVTAGLRLLKAGDDELELASINIPIEIVRGTASVELQEFVPRRLIPGRRFEARLRTNLEKEDHQQLGLRFQLGEQKPDGLTLDPDSGYLTWTPNPEQIGLHTITVAITTSTDDNPVDEDKIELAVMAPVMTMRLPDFPEQSAEAGATFEFPLNLPNRRRLLTLFDIKTGPGAPQGVQVDLDAGMVRWEIPSNVSGTIRIPLVAETKLPGLRMSPGSRLETVLVVNVSQSSPPMSVSNLPDRDAVDAALAKHRETYRSSIAAARNLTTRAALAARLFSQSHDLESGAAHLALLELIDEIGLRARAYDVLLDVGQERFKRYSIEEFEPATEIIDSFRRTGLTAIQRDLILEHALRLSVASAEQDQPALAAQFVEFALQLIRGTEADPILQTDLEQSKELCNELAKEGNQADNQLKQNELKRLLSRWNFAEEFRRPELLQFIEASGQGTSLQNSGRELWTIDDNQIELESRIENALVGIVLPTELTSAFVVRFSLLPSSNATQILLADDDASNTQAVRISLATSDPGRIVNLTTNEVVSQATANAAAAFVNDRDNQVELAVNSGTVILKVNGVIIQQTALPDVSGVRLGIGADLRQPDPKLRIRNVRILKLPTEPA